jgi:hypothetical protein
MGGAGFATVLPWASLLTVVRVPSGFRKTVVVTPLFVVLPISLGPAATGAGVVPVAPPGAPGAPGARLTPPEFVGAGGCGFDGVCGVPPPGAGWFVSGGVLPSVEGGVCGAGVVVPPGLLLACVG